MKRYAATLKQHLGHYGSKRLGVEEHGIYKGRRYAHILPARLRCLNFLEPVRAELQAYLKEHPSIKLHQFFHHLNSSQAFAFNLFYPYFVEGSPTARILAKSLGVDAEVDTWEFEAVLDREEGTNVDVLWTTMDGARVFCEVKLTENEFGQAKNDKRHQKKLIDIYMPRLRSLVSDELLIPKMFFKHYQILRNISLLAERSVDQLVFLMPRENETLSGPLNRVLAGTQASVSRRIHLAYIEDCLDNLESSVGLPLPLRVYSSALKEKYVI